MFPNYESGKGEYAFYCWLSEIPNWVRRVSDQVTNQKFQKSNIILEGFRHPIFMNPFENGKKHHNKSFWKIIGTLIMIKPNCKILPPPPKVTGSVQIGWANRVKHFAIFLLFFGSDFPLHAVHFLTLVLCQRDEKPNWVISSKSTNFRALHRGRPFFVISFMVLLMMREVLQTLNI